MKNFEERENQIKHSTAADGKPPVVCSCLSEEFVEDFTSDGELTPIDIVAEITGLTYDEIRSCSKIVRVPQQLHTTTECMLCSRIAERRFVDRQIKPQAGEKATTTHTVGYKAYTCVIGSHF